MCVSFIEMSKPAKYSMGVLLLLRFQSRFYRLHGEQPSHYPMLQNSWKGTFRARIESESRMQRIEVALRHCATFCGAPERMTSDGIHRLFARPRTEDRRRIERQAVD